MFFLSTIDHQGRPTVSYKGGDPGFVRVIDRKTVAFPCYDGNGMFYSMGNLLGNQQVGLLFINFERPHRLRLQGVASVDDNDPLLSEFAEAQLVVRVLITEIFRNCPRYVHRYKKTEPSEFVPRATCETPLAPLKRIDDVQTALPAKDRARVEREGLLISRSEYENTWRTFRVAKSRTGHNLFFGVSFQFIEDFGEVVARPALGDFITDDVINMNAFRVNFKPGRRNVAIGSKVRCVQAPTRHHLVALRKHVFDGHVPIRKCK